MTEVIKNLIKIRDEAVEQKNQSRVEACQAAIDILFKERTGLDA